MKLSGGTTFDAERDRVSASSIHRAFRRWPSSARDFAEALFPKQNALGKTFYDDQSKPYKIIGVIEHMHGSWVGWDKVDRVMLSPMVGPKPGIRYIVRTKPGEIDRVMTAVETALRKRDPNRVIGKLAQDVRAQASAATPAIRSWRSRCRW